ncbi:2-haloacid halidohydrolase IVa (plasmid) [Roseomonas mucosa]|uniref:(S)-2-haloacid dehalogenase n=1 Tax=Roseomonas mucosa TaxID=207340 RepID=A0A379PJK6_9PROT|nr:MULTISPECIES: haloacid dehalogenase type II [Roseomonas]MBS5904799.1 haloacid dehalogenase type II [Acetobacteraceae bacterium]MCG7352990.1 haloacid dehalogenase type II [Roseomonas mucosa]MCG7358457.1 haloacid dehalogenase type II [Roseomonas mucosa]MDT8291700.1 haloacid dehalogenase type II [Roseomonas mucosa]MDT8295983.1 haloacid dehalogenase type II [Roseomonas mucosa]
MRLTDFKVLTFDCYGTLIDWESGMIEGLRPLTEKVGRPLGRNEILEAHAFHESTQQIQTPARPYAELLPIVYKRLAEQWGVPVTLEECLAYGRSVGNWPAFEDSPGALRYLKKFYKLVILSNVDNASFAASNKRLQVEFDAIITAEDAGSYKPSPRNFEYMLQRLGAGLGGEKIGKEHILHTAESMFHDHRPANAFGLASCWIYRRHKDQGFGATMNPGTMPHVDFQFNSMADLVKAHQEQLRA